MQEVDFDKVITLPQAAVMLKRTRVRAFQMFKEGKLRGKKLSDGVIIIDRQSVQDFIDKR